MSASVQRRALEDELRLVLEQKAAIEAQLAALRSGGRGLSQSKSLKRNSAAIPPKTHVPPTKKQKVRVFALTGSLVTSPPDDLLCSLLGHRHTSDLLLACPTCMSTKCQQLTHLPWASQQVEDRQKRIQSLWGQTNTVLKQISKQRDAAHFLTPVDAEKLKV